MKNKEFMKNLAFANPDAGKWELRSAKGLPGSYEYAKENNSLPQVDINFANINLAYDEPEKFSVNERKLYETMRQILGVSNESIAKTHIVFESFQKIQEDIKNKKGPKSTKGFFTPPQNGNKGGFVEIAVMPDASSFDLNSTLLHELTHLADYERDPELFNKNKERKYLDRPSEIRARTSQLAYEILKHKNREKSRKFLEKVDIIQTPNNKINPNESLAGEFLSEKILDGKLERLKFPFKTLRTKSTELVRGSRKILPNRGYFFGTLNSNSLSPSQNMAISAVSRFYQSITPQAKKSSNDAHKYGVIMAHPPEVAKTLSDPDGKYQKAIAKFIAKTDTKTLKDLSEKEAAHCAENAKQQLRRAVAEEAFAITNFYLNLSGENPLSNFDILKTIDDRSFLNKKTDAWLSQPLPPEKFRGSNGKNPFTGKKLS